MDKKSVLLGSCIGMLAVLLGAFGAHGLEKIATADAVASFVTGVRYQLFHAFLLLFTGTAAFISSKRKRQLSYVIMAGIVLFSGSIYLLVLDEHFGFNASSIAFITPLGGLLLITGWILLIITVLQYKQPEEK